MLNDNTIALYVLLDDMLQSLSHKEDSQRKVNDALILTTVLISAWYFGSNWQTGISYMRSHHCPQMLSKSRFCRRVHQLEGLGKWCFALLGWTHKELNTRQHYVLDTFPVAVCQNIRIGRCRLLQGEDFRGYKASKREYFYGFKVALLVDEGGNPIELAIYAGGYSEHSALHRLDFDLPAGSIVWQDSGFTDYGWEDFYQHEEGIQFATQRKKNAHRHDTWQEQIAKKYHRRVVENAFSQITARFPKKIHAVTIQGFQLKVFAVILAYSFLQIITQ